MRALASIALVALVALLAGGCGGSNDGETESVTATENAAAVTQAKWEHTPSCDRPGGASRWGCSVGDYRCQAVVVDRGWSVSCSRPGRSVAFTVRP
jgi:hypothetical protein